MAAGRSWLSSRFFTFYNDLGSCYTTPIVWQLNACRSPRLGLIYVQYMINFADQWGIVIFIVNIVLLFPNNMINVSQLNALCSIVFKQYCFRTFSKIKVCVWVGFDHHCKCHIVSRNNYSITCTILVYFPVSTYI
jgi:hypothetical protein